MSMQRSEGEILEKQEFLASYIKAQLADMAFGKEAKKILKILQAKCELGVIQEKDEYIQIVRDLKVGKCDCESSNKIYVDIVIMYIDQIIMILQELEDWAEMKKDVGKRPIGLIELNDTCLVTDPCYTKGTWCATQLDNVLPGKWEVFITKKDEGDWGVRVSSISLAHLSYTYKENALLETYDAHLGVDSGQISFFQPEVYKNRGEDDDSEEFYDKCCYLSKPAGIFEQDGKNVGVVTSSGYGDGGYNLYINRNEDEKIVYMEVVFIEDEIEGVRGINFTATFDSNFERKDWSGFVEKFKEKADLYNMMFDGSCYDIEEGKIEYIIRDKDGNDLDSEQYSDWIKGELPPLIKQAKEKGIQLSYQLVIS